MKTEEDMYMYVCSYFDDVHPNSSSGFFLRAQTVYKYCVITFFRNHITRECCGNVNDVWIWCDSGRSKEKGSKHVYKGMKCS